MADNTELNTGSGGDTIATDDIAGVKHQRVKIEYGADGSATDVSDANPLPIDDAGGSLTVDNAQLSVVGGGTEATAMRVTLANDSTGLVSVDDNGGSLTIDGTVTANLSATDNAVLDQIEVNTSYGDNTGGGVEAGSLRVTMANDSTGVLSVDDNGGTLTVDNAGLTELAAAINASNQMDVNIADSNATVTVDGTVTANLSATDNAVLDQIEVNTSYGDNTGGGVEAGSLRVTIANDSTGVVTVDDGGGSLTVDGTITEANSGTIAGDTTSIDGKITACNTGAVVLDTGAATIGEVTIGAATTAAADLAKVVDAVAGGSDVGVATLAVRDDSLTALTPADGDYAPLRVNSTGALHVTGGGGGTEYNVSDASPTVVTMAGTIRDDSLTTLTEVDGDASLLRVNSTGALHVTGGGGGTEYTEDVATPNPIVGTATMMERDDVLAGLTPAEGDWAGLRCSAEGALWMQDFNSDGILADTTTIAGDTTSIDGKITACNTGAVVISSGTVTTVTSVTNDVNIADGGNSITVDNGGTFATQAESEGDVAHDAADSGNPVKTGSKAVLFNSSAPPNAAAAENDRVNHIADEYGRQYVEITHPNYWDVSADYAGAQTNTTIKAAAGAGLSLYLTDIIISNGAVAGNITLLDGSGGTVLLELYPAITGGMTHSFRSPIKLTANTLLAITSTTVTTHSVTVSGFIAP